MKEASDKRVQQLRSDIESVKIAKVQLLKKMRAESDRCAVSALSVRHMTTGHDDQPMARETGELSCWTALCSSVAHALSPRQVS